MLKYINETVNLKKVSLMHLTKIKKKINKK